MTSSDSTRTPESARPAATPTGVGIRFRPPERVRELPRYPLADVPRIKARLAAEGREVLDLGAGDSGLPVPDLAVEALREAAGDPSLQGYGFQRGLPEFREAVSDWMERRYGRRPDPETEVLPLIGSKEGIAHLALAVLGRGDGALVPDPGYAPYFGGSHFAGARVERAPLRAEHDFRIPPERIREAADPLRIVYLNYPNNPTGATVGLDYVEAVAAACTERGAVLCYDNAYAEIGFDGYRPPGLLEIPDGLEAGLEFHSFSKSFNMTGWRLGWAVGAAPLVAALERVKTFFDTGPYLAIQAAGAAVLRNAERYLEENVARLRARRDAAVAAFREAGFRIDPPRSTLYLWMPVPTDESSEAFARTLLEQEAVVLMPGSSLGAGGEGYVRAALTLPEDRYAEAAERIRRRL